jgi:hypothetical protein
MKQVAKEGSFLIGITSRTRLPRKLNCPSRISFLRMFRRVMELSQYFRVPEEKSVPLNLEHIII